MSKPPRLQADQLSKSYTSGPFTIQVLNQVHLSLQPREMVAIVGASGAGKTTLLQVLGTLDQADSGSLTFEGKELSGKSERELAAHRNSNIGFIFQFHHLLPEFTALENIMMPGLIHGMEHGRLEARAQEFLHRIQLDHRSHHRSGELSGGEQQRVALARALIMEPALLLADEPTGNLDSTSGKMVFSLLRELSDAMGLSVIMVTHNLQLARRLDRCLTLADGSLK
ncbi:ABC transporter ATP-binding protein [Desulfogranum mediterraneum]|uniref:ABC transporter ATP-binding protein n=1 Tax=Desulfogranum mediterraneum TaxID=160661 RepID=UPI0004219107|nr:ABC transporter ATP-binding protein [Desulfogranum mediterraneum]